MNLLAVKLLLAASSACPAGTPASACITVGGKGGLIPNAPQVVWNIPSGLQDASSRVAFILILIWLVWIAKSYALPSKRAQMGSQQVGWGKFMAAGVLCIFLLDLSLIPTAINGFLDLAYWVGQIVGLVHSSSTAPTGAAAASPGLLAMSTIRLLLV